MQKILTLKYKFQEHVSILQKKMMEKTLTGEYDMQF